MRHSGSRAPSRRGFLYAAAGHGAAVLTRAGRAADQPNIVLITTDQQSADAMSCRIGDRY